MAQADRDGGKQACTVIAGVLFHALDIVHASVLVTPQTQRVRLADGISRQLTRIEHGFGEVLSCMPEDQLSTLTKLLLEIEYFEIVRRYRITVPRCLVFGRGGSTFAVLLALKLRLATRRWKR